MASNYRKVLHGYTTQARFYANQIQINPADEEWVSPGWTRMENGHVKPVFLLLDGRPFVILNGTSHLDAVITSIDPATIRATEEECYPPRVVSVHA